MPFGNDLYSVAAVGAQSVYVGGTKGFIARYDGTRWEHVRESSEPYALVSSLWAAADDDVIGVGGSEIATWDGVAWRTTAPPVSFVNAVHGTSSADVWLAGDRGAVLHGPDGGYTQLNPSNDVRVLTGVWAATADDVWAVGEDETTPVVVHGSSGGWADESIDAGVPLRALAAVFGTGVSDVWAVGNDEPGDRGYILYRSGNGEWSADTSGAAASLPMMTALWGRDDVMHAAGAAGTVVSRAGGPWHREQIDQLEYVTLRALSGAAVDDVWAVGDSGTLVHKTAAGWSLVTRGPRLSVTAIGAAAPDLFAVTEDGKVLARDAGTWNVVREDDTTSLRALYLSDDDGFAVGSDGHVLRKSAGWQRMQQTVSTAFLFAAGGAAARVYAGGEAETVLELNGNEWIIGHEVTGSARIVRGIHAIADDDVWAVGGSLDTSVNPSVGMPLLLHRTTQWNEVTVIPGMHSHVLHAVWASSPSDVYVVAERVGEAPAGAVFHFDGGEWAPVILGAAVPSSGPPPLFGVQGSSGDDVWVVGADGVVLKGSGGTWSSVDSGLTAPLLATFGDGSGRWLVGGGGAIIRRQE